VNHFILSSTVLDAGLSIFFKKLSSYYDKEVIHEYKDHYLDGCGNDAPCRRSADR
jgi:hypothetical protein